MLFAGKLSVGIRVLIATLAVALAVMGHFMGLDTAISDGAQSIEPFGAFFVGMFYTLGITTPTAFMILVEMMLENCPIHVALAASFAAAAADTALFMLMKNELERGVGRIMDALHARLGRHNTIFPLAGLLVFGSPLPDEFALALMRMSDIRPERVFFVVFAAKLVTLLSVYSAIRSSWL